MILLQHCNILLSLSSNKAINIVGMTLLWHVMRSFMRTLIKDKLPELFSAAKCNGSATSQQFTVDIFQTKVFEESQRYH